MTSLKRSDVAFLCINSEGSFTGQCMLFSPQVENCHRWNNHWKEERLWYILRYLWFCPAEANGGSSHLLPYCGAHNLEADANRSPGWLRKADLCRLLPTLQFPSKKLISTSCPVHIVTMKQILPPQFTLDEAHDFSYTKIISIYGENRKQRMKWPWGSMSGTDTLWKIGRMPSPPPTY